MTMRIIGKSGAMLFVFVLWSHGDSPIPPRAEVITSISGTSFVVMVPAKTDPQEEREVVLREPFCACYNVDADGNLVERWRASGWYAREVYLSNSGEYLVRLGPWHRGAAPREGDLGVAFYKNGRLLIQYSVLDLVDDSADVLPTVSHYKWLARSAPEREQNPDPNSILKLEADEEFHLKTCDDIEYVFDIRTGRVLSKTVAPAPRRAQLKPPLRELDGQ